jgi:uncharacterized repeat protein (TIGR01451 family)
MRGKGQARRSWHLVRYPLAIVIGLLAAAGLALPGPAGADHMPNTLLVTVTDSPDPAASLGEIIETIAVKNDGRQRSLNVRIEATIPAGASYVTCKTSSSAVPCSLSGDAVTVTAVFPKVAAHGTVKMTLTIKAPLVVVATVIKLNAGATGTYAHKGDGSQSTTVLPPVSGALLLPSGLGVGIACGDTIDAAFMGADTTLLLQQGLVCNAGSGLRITASGMTLDLGGKKIVRATPQAAGDAGIVVGPNAANVTIRGGGTEGTKGIEQFDYCVKDEGGNTNLAIVSLRCFRARSAGLEITSDGVLVEKSLVDNTIPTSNTTAAPPEESGVGIRARSDNVHLKDTIVRRSKRVGVWAHGIDADGDGLALKMDGNTTTSRVETNYNIGVLLEGGPHLIKDTRVQGDSLTGTSTDGVVVAPTAIGARLDGVSIRIHRGVGVWVEGVGTEIERGGVENIGGIGYLLLAPAMVGGTSATLVAGDAYRVEATAGGSVLDTNGAENSPGNGFVVNAAALLSGNSAVEVGGWGFVIGGSGAYLDTNGAEVDGAGFRVTGDNNVLESNSAKSTSGIGFEILGTGNRLNTDKAERNAGAELWIGPGNIDDGGNSANGTRLSFGPAGGVFE